VIRKWVFNTSPIILLAKISDRIGQKRRKAMLSAKENIISMIEHLPEQKLQKVVNYIILIKKEKNDEIRQIDFSHAKFEIYHDLDSLAGTWTNGETQEFLTAIADFNQVDEKLWQ
jgi:hypothetical protein